MNNENKRIDIDAIEKEWTDFVNSKKFNVNEFAYNVQPMIAELKRCYEEMDKLNRALSIINNTHFPKE